MTETTVTGEADPSAAHRLPYSVQPLRYELRLAPDLERATFDGDIRIEAVVHERVAEIVLHAAELSVGVAQLHAPGTSPAPLVTRLDPETERLVLTPPRPLDPGPVAIRIEFSGVLNDALRGFYLSEFTDDAGTTRKIATTQFEATDARRAFPCFDEPDRKAVFSISLDVPPGLAAFSNGKEIDDTLLSPGARRVRFGDTIPMSTYLVAFIVGPLEATQPRHVRGTPVRIVHVPGKQDLTAFALEVASHALQFFTDWFGIEYPAEKLDLVAIPDFAFGAMENLGCVTFREAVLLVDPHRASRLELERVADVICHELAHMWFGDLVTMKWWNGIWLNEAFATMMELLCVDAFRPEWERWVSFGIERDAAMATDALHNTRPVEYPVGSPDEAQGMFDVLTYQKGAGVLRMLERYLGADVFRDGIRRYLEAHRLSNTETSDLWDALEEASGEPVGAIMSSWIFQGGFPLVTVTASTADGGPPGALTVTQEPFAYAAAHGPSAIGAQWHTPVIARSLDGAEIRTLLTATPERLPEFTRGPVVVNAGGWGYYRVRYPAEHRLALAAHITGLDQLERYNLLGDTWAAVVADHSTLNEVFVLAESLRKEEEPDVWTQVTGALSFLDHAVVDEDRSALAAYTRLLLAPLFARLGWEARSDEAVRTPAMRAQLVATLGTVGGDAGVRIEARHRLDATAQDRRDLDPDLAAAILGVVATSGGGKEFDVFLERYRHPATPQEELRYLFALAAFREDVLAARAFELALTEVRSQNVPLLIHLLLSNRDAGPATWARVRHHWGELMDRTPVNIAARMLDGVKSLCRDGALADDITSFVEANPVPVGQRTVQQIMERLGVNVAFASRLRSAARPAIEAGIERLGGHRRRQPSTG
jgi:puromycin-sensitive aminopeptidase